MSLSDKIKASAVKDTHWLKEAKERQKNEHWLDLSFRIAVRILQYLRAQKMTQKELSDKLNCSPQYLSKVLKGNENLTLETITRIQNILGIPLIQIPDAAYQRVERTEKKEALTNYNATRQFQLKIPVSKEEYAAYYDEVSPYTDVA